MKKLLMFIFCLGFNLSVVYAAPSASISVNKSSVENGGSVSATVTVKSTAAWNIKISSSGATSGCTQKFADATSNGQNTTKYFTVTCKATSIGTINFTMTGDITDASGNNITVSGSRNVSVVKPREKSSNNYLKSLSVEGYEISPAFDKKTSEYTVSVPSTVSKINIIATKEDSYSSISGTGEKEVSEGVNTFDITVTSETGVANIYSLKVNVLDQNPIEVTVDNKKYTVVKESKNLTKPELFEEATVKIGEFDIPAFKNETTGYTLVGLKDESGNISLFIYDDGKYKSYDEYLTKRLTLVFVTPKDRINGFTSKTVTINEKEISAFTDGKITIVYAINLEDGKEAYYKFDGEVMQKFDVDDYNKEVKDKDLKEGIIYGLAALSLGLFLVIILILVKNKKKLVAISEKIKENC
ncbi:MAG: cadherin-like beta sandwich domain-containing protein [bacterium]|nr:cadherin-like beta sandwich domain-containing protein [bacterium]